MLTGVLVDVGLLALGLGAGAVGAWLLLRRAAHRAPSRIVCQTVTEQVRAVGRLVALEVSAKEIATAAHGWSWMPAVVVSPAKVAMIFHFRRQYSVDLARLSPADVEPIEPGRFRIVLPALEASNSLHDVSPYDIQHGRFLGLVDVIPMNAERQDDLMQQARAHAASVLGDADGEYLAAAQSSVERQLKRLLALVGIDAELVWHNPPITPEVHAAPVPSAVPVLSACA